MIWMKFSGRKGGEKQEKEKKVEEDTPPHYLHINKSETVAQKLDTEPLAIMIVQSVIVYRCWLLLCPSCHRHHRLGIVIVFALYFGRTTDGIE